MWPVKSVWRHKPWYTFVYVYGIWGIVNNYLCDQSQFVNIDGNMSASTSSHVVFLNVPFLGLYSTWFHKSCNSHILSYANDATLFVYNSDIGSLYEEANK